jgi:hypothetical protein
MPEKTSPRGDHVNILKSLVWDADTNKLAGIPPLDAAVVFFLFATGCLFWWKLITLILGAMK